jgi:chaperonin GroEL (HSP60 family)
VLAVLSIANIVKSSLGPVGLDKMLVDEIGVSNTLMDRAKHRVTKDSFYVFRMSQYQTMARRS